MPSKYGPLVTEFYHSPAWRKCSKSFASDKRFICERCGKYCEGHMIVHHKIRLNETNVRDPNVSLNWNNLELLCIDCHNKEHFGTDKVEEHHDIIWHKDGTMEVLDKK